MFQAMAMELLSIQHWVLLLCIHVMTHMLCVEMKLGDVYPLACGQDQCQIVLVSKNTFHIITYAYKYICVQELWPLWIPPHIQ